MKSKGRSIKGETNANSKLTDKDVLDIRNSDEPNKTLAEKYNIGSSTVSDIRSGTTWKHLPPRKDKYISPMFKLTDQKALEILNSNESNIDLAQKYGVSISQITRIKRGERWRHLHE